MEQAATDPDACPLGKPILAVPRDGMGRSVSGAVEPSCRSGRSCVDVLAPQMSVARRALQFRMVRDPSIVSPTLTGVFIGGGHNKHGTGSRCTLPKQCRPPSPRRRWRCDRSSYKRSLFSRIRGDSLMHYLTGQSLLGDQ